MPHCSDYIILHYRFAANAATFSWFSTPIMHFYRVLFSFADAAAAFHFHLHFHFRFLFAFSFLCWLFEAANLQMSLNVIFIGRANVLHCVFNALIVVPLLRCPIRGRGSIYHCSRRVKARYSVGIATFYERLIWATLVALKSHKCCASFISRPKKKKKSKQSE